MSLSLLDFEELSGTGAEAPLSLLDFEELSDSSGTDSLVTDLSVTVATPKLSVI